MGAYDVLKQKGIQVPPPAPKGGLYTPVRVSGSLAFVSGQTPTVEGKPMMTGTVGDDLTLEQGQACAYQCALNTLSALEAHFGSLDKIKGCVKLFGLVRSAASFGGQPQVINAASQLFIDVFGDDGWHARSAIGTNALPFGVPVEIESVFEIR